MFPASEANLGTRSQQFVQISLNVPVLCQYPKASLASRLVRLRTPYVDPQGVGLARPTKRSWFAGAIFPGVATRLKALLIPCGQRTGAPFVDDLFQLTQSACKRCGIGGLTQISETLDLICRLQKTKPGEHGSDPFLSAVGDGHECSKRLLQRLHLRRRGQHEILPITAVKTDLAFGDSGQDLAGVLQKLG